MDDFIGELLDRIDASGQNFSQRAYRGAEPGYRAASAACSSSSPSSSTAFSFFLGTSRISVAEVIGRLARVLVIFIIVTSWANFNSIVYKWITTVPEDAGRAILAASATGVTEPSNGLSQIWRTANVAAAAFSEQAGYLVRPAGTDRPDHHGVCRPVRRGRAWDSRARQGGALGAAGHGADLHFLLLLQLDHGATRWAGSTSHCSTRSFRLFVYVIAAFLIAAMEPELTKIDQISGNRELKLSDFAAFIMLCLAGSFVLLQVQSLAQGHSGRIGHADWTAFAPLDHKGDFLESRGNRPIGTTDPGCRPSRPGEASFAPTGWRGRFHAASDHVQWNAKAGVTMAS